MTVITEYVDSLTTTLGSPEFEGVFAAMKADPAVTAKVAKAIAREFAKKAGRSKAEALHLILYRHRNILGAKARADSIGGRTAA